MPNNQSNQATDEKPTKPILKTVDALTLQQTALKPVPFVVSGLLPAGLAILAAPPKSGKSWLALSLCLSVADGSPFLGRNTAQGTALYLALEDSWNRLQARTNVLLDGAAAPAPLHVAINAPSLNNGLVGMLAAFVEQHPDCRLICIDTLQKVRDPQTSRESSYGFDYRSLSPLKAFADEKRLCILLVHHTRKAAADTDPFEKISGTTAVSGAADTTLMLARDKRGDQRAKLLATGRDISYIEEMLLFDCGRWISEGSADEVFERLERAAWRNNAFVKALNQIVSESGIWIGPASALFEECCKRGCYEPKAPSALSKELLRIRDRLYRYDGIAYTPPTTSGRSGRLHKLQCVSVTHEE